MKKIIILSACIVISVLQFSCKKEPVAPPPPPPPPPENEAPVANAGPDLTITFPQNSVTLIGSGFDPEGSTLAFKWIWISGPSSSVIVHPDQAQTTVNHLIAGVHQFQLTVTDNLGLTGKDTMTVIVNSGSVEAPLYSGWFTVDTIYNDFSYPGSSYFWSEYKLDSPLVFSAPTQVALSYVKMSTAQGTIYQRELLEVDISDTSRIEPYSYIAWFGYYYNNTSHEGILYIEGASNDYPEPPVSVTLSANATILSSQFRIIVVPLSTYNNSGINWDNYLEVVATLNISP